MKVKNDHRSKFSNLSNWKEEAWKKKKSGLQRDSNPWPPRSRYVALPHRAFTFWFKNSNPNFKPFNALPISCENKRKSNIFLQECTIVSTPDYPLQLYTKQPGQYTCQLSRLRRESHACGLKTSISHPLTPADQFLTPDWKMWVVTVLLDTISKNMLTQTHVRNENHV